MKALGMIEMQGYPGSVQAVDTMVKSSDIEVLGVKEIGDGYISVFVAGDIGAVKEAVDTGSESVKRIGNLISSHVIAHPDPETLKMIPSVGTR